MPLERTVEGAFLSTLDDSKKNQKIQVNFAFFAQILDTFSKNHPKLLEQPPRPYPALRALTVCGGLVGAWSPNEQRAKRFPDP